MRPLTIAAVALAAPAALLAQPASLVQDIRVTPNTFAGLEPANLAGLGNTAFFAGRSDAHGVELWKSDGTPGGTALVKDIWPGAEVTGRETAGSSAPRQLQAVGGLVYFVADDGNAGRELWRSDGSIAGTFLLKDIAPGRAGAILEGNFAYRVHLVAGMALFAADDGVHGRELWRTDGTPAGTTMVVDACPGSCDGVTGLPGAVFGGRLYFVGQTPLFNRQLWRSDGTAAGTEPFADVVDPGSLTAAGSTLYFGAYDAAHGGELWATDGTVEGTRLVHDIRPGPDTSFAGEMAAFGDSVYFGADDGVSGSEPWTSDGTAAGTRRVADVASGPTSSFPRSFVAIATKVCFINWPDSDVWCTDGATTTRLVDTLNTSAPLVAHQGQLVFVARTVSSYSARLFWSDGTPAGTRAVGTIDADWSGTGPASVGGRLFLAGAHMDVFLNRELELWTSNGTDAGTVQVVDVASVSSNPHSLTALGERVVFAAGGETGFEPWSSDGSAAGTFALGDFCFGACSWLPFVEQPQQPLFAPAGGHVLFEGRSDANGSEPWRTDGTAGGTGILFDVLPGTAPSEPETFVSAGPRAFFFAGNPTIGRELWSSDGTPSGTALVRDLNPGPNSFGGGSAAVAAQDVLFMTGRDDTHGTELFKSDGTFAGTGLVEDLSPGPASSSFFELAPSGSTVYFRAPHSFGPLHHSDGTASGTHAIPSAATDITQITDVGGTVFFRARVVDSGLELWKSDGTAAGTVMVRDIVPGPLGSVPSHLVNVDGVLYFTASDVDHGAELWRSDGTAAGTQMVRDIVPGPDGSRPSSLAAANGRLYFAAYEPANGVELWTSDGTAAGTQRVQDIAAGGASSTPAKLTMVGSRLFFVAGAGTNGRELWSVPDLLPSVAIATVLQPEGDAGSQPATFEVRVTGSHASPVTVSFATADGSAVAGSDYEAAFGDLTFPPGPSASQTFDVPVLGDTVEEPDEDFTIVLGAVTGAVTVGGAPRGIVVNDDSPVTVSIADGETVEMDQGTHDALLAVRLSAPRGVPVTVDFATADQTAVAPGDYASSAGTVTFPPGSTVAQAAVPVRGEDDLEFDETFAVQIANPVNATLADASAVATILNDDPLGAPGLELAHGMSVVRDLSTPGTFRIAQKARSSYEVVMDEVTPDAFVSMVLEDEFGGSLPVADQVIGVGKARSLRWMNSTASEVTSQLVEVATPSCAPCAATDRYRLRAYETTIASPRYTNAGALRTVVTLQNRGTKTVNAQMYFWNADGTILNMHPFSLAPREVLKLETWLLLLLDTASGTITVAHDGRYGDLVGKAATIDTINGFTFDHAFVGRPR